MRLTDKAVATLSLPKHKREAIFFDDDLAGFGIRLRTGGAARWVYQYNIGKRTRRITMGSTAALTATRARASASELHARVRLGADPAGEKAESRVRAGETFEAALRVYLSQQRAKLKPLSYTQKERHLLKHCRALHGLQLGKVDRRAVAARLTTVAAKSGPIESNRVRASLSAFFSWCIAQGFADSNPVVGTERHPEKSRDRVLSPAELKAIWQATAGTDDYSAIVRLLLLSGCRADEIGGLRWNEIFGDKIVLPGPRTKNLRDHSVPLAAPARSIIAARPKMLDCDFVFGRGKDRGFTGWSSCKILLDDRIRANGAKVGHWTNHDLRRTAATSMAELGVQPHVIEAVLNHVSGHKAGVAGIYNRAGYENEKRAALTLWADKLLEIVEGRAPAESTPTAVEPAPAPAAGNLIDGGKVTIVGKSGSKVDARHHRPMDITDWGRPSPRDDYRQEAERRLKDGEVSPEMTHKEFANDLRDWFINKWPERKPPAARTIENNTVDLWRRYERG